LYNETVIELLSIVTFPVIRKNCQSDVILITKCPYHSEFSTLAAQELNFVWCLRKLAWMWPELFGAGVSAQELYPSLPIHPCYGH
jgi:hypothetical protein